jgi:kynurenine formamidase
MTIVPGERAWTGWLPALGHDPGWTDLTYTITPDVPRLMKFAPPSIHRVSSMPEDPYSVTAIEIVCHTGTHLDAPCHFIPGAPAIDEVPLDRLTGAAVVVRPELRSDREIRASDLEPSGARAGEMVILDSGWWRAGVGDGDHPWLSEEGARWLVARGVKLLATDLPTPDLPICRRDAGFDWPVHRILLGSGVLIAENLTNLAALPSRVEAMLLPLPIAGSDGSPARVLVRPLRPA